MDLQIAPHALLHVLPARQLLLTASHATVLPTVVPARVFGMAVTTALSVLLAASQVRVLELVLVSSAVSHPTVAHSVTPTTEYRIAPHVHLHVQIVSQVLLTALHATVLPTVVPARVFGMAIRAASGVLETVPQVRVRVLASV